MILNYLYKYMKTLKQYIFESHGLFNGCYDIVDFVAEYIQKHCSKHTTAITEFPKKITNVIFFKELLLNISLSNYSDGRYRPQNNYDKDADKLEQCYLKITVNKNDIDGIKEVLIHELTHAFEDLNRQRKDGVASLFDFDMADVSDSYYKALNVIRENPMEDKIKQVRTFIAYYIYLTDKSEINAFIAQFNYLSQESRKLHFDTYEKQHDVMMHIYSEIKNSTVYKKYMEVGKFISTLDKQSDKTKQAVTNVYNKMKDTSKTFNQILNEMTATWDKIKKRLETTIPKIVYSSIK